jgi:tetratricopeptide (TPR) repeat protein
LWDYDTLRDEQRGLPAVASILAGKWERHSGFFYEHRIDRMRAHLADKPDDLDALDNLAVALEKLGRIDEAIATLEPVIAEHPDRYTAQANLGTFYLHRFLDRRDRADLDRGIGHIEQALEINPDAHFGREEYQLELARHVRRSLDDPALLDGPSFVAPMLLGDGLTREEQQERMRQIRGEMAGVEASRPEVEHAIEGIVGMIRFGTGTSPNLYHALGDLLAARKDKHLAAWAYLRAIEFGHPEPQLLEDAVDDLRAVIGEEPTRAELRNSLDAAIAEADAWVGAFQAWQAQILRDGRDPTSEANLAGFYAEHGDAGPRLGFAWEDHLPRQPAARTGLIVLAVVAVVFVLGLFLLVRWLRRHRVKSFTPAR